MEDFDNSFIEMIGKCSCIFGLQELMMFCMDFFKQDVVLVVIFLMVSDVMVSFCE